jgi:hypothetical protein
MGNGRIPYCRPSGNTSKQVRDARVRAWVFVFDCYARKKAAPSSRPDDAEGESSDDRASTILSEKP